MSSLPPIDRAQLVATRRDLHQHPELGFEERRTSGLVAERLERLGYAVRTGVGKTGVVGLRDGAAAAEARCVLIRADMDALPIEEANDVPYRSQHAGKMHACGHDGHVAIGLEVARRLHAAFLPGSVKLAFQPAEEISHGAEAMIRDGVLDAPTVHAAFGIHLWNDLPAGTIALIPGPVMASVDEFEIAILGSGGLGAAPHQVIDPVLIAAHVVTGLQSLVSRRRNPFEEGVLSVTQLHAGHAFNVIPGRADLRGTVRTFGGKFYDEAPQLVEETARGIARAFGADAEVRYRRLSKPPPTSRCTGTRGATPRSHARAPKTSPSSWISARYGATGATSWTVSRTKIRRSPRSSIATSCASRWTATSGPMSMHATSAPCRHSPVRGAGPSRRSSRRRAKSSSAAPTSRLKRTTTAGLASAPCSARWRASIASSATRWRRARKRSAAIWPSRSTRQSRVRSRRRPWSAPRATWPACSTSATAGSAPRPSFLTPRPCNSCSRAGTTRARTGCARWWRRRSSGWRKAGSGTTWVVDSIATRWTSAGSCRTSKRWRTTMRSCCKPTWMATRGSDTRCSRKWPRASRAGCSRCSRTSSRALSTRPRTRTCGSATTATTGPGRSMKCGMH